MELVIDANILMSALIAIEGVTFDIIFNDRVKLFAPEFLLDEVENNAIEKGLDENKLFVKHMVTSGGRQKRWNRGSRVFGRRTQKRARASNMEVVVAER